MEIEKRIYYKINMTLASPLAIGSGLNGETDKDVILNSRKQPFIPATSFAGVLRSYIQQSFGDRAKEIFGDVVPKTKNITESKIRVYDADLVSEEAFISARDNVALKNKVGIDGAKFDMQIVETGAQFTGYLELMDKQYCSEIETALSALNRGEIGFGGKTTRGFGRVKADVYKKEFEISSEKYTDWLKFDMFDSACWQGVKKLDLSNTSNSIILKLELKIKSGISIREYTTEVSNDTDTAPDYKSLTLKSGVPVIPGTSWAGAFRSRFLELSDEQLTNDLFGFVDKKAKASQISKIKFSESQIKNNIIKLTTRNSIDRFSASTKDGALYTERTSFGGQCELDIVLENDISDEKLYTLGAVICDLHNGFLSVGGLTSIGRGLFEVEKITCPKKDLTSAIHECKLDDFVRGVKEND